MKKDSFPNFFCYNKVLILKMLPNNHEIELSHRKSCSDGGQKDRLQHFQCLWQAQTGTNID